MVFSSSGALTLREGSSGSIRDAPVCAHSSADVHIKIPNIAALTVGIATLVSSLTLALIREPLHRRNLSSTSLRYTITL